MGLRCRWEAFCEDLLASALCSDDLTLGSQVASQGTAASSCQLLILREVDLWGHLKTRAAASQALLATDGARGSAAVPGD